MRLIGCGLLAGAGIWSGVLAARCASEEAERCGAWCRMLELMSFELERFRTPLPELFAGLSARLDGMPGELCADVSSGLSESSDFRIVWQRSVERLPAPEGSILRSLGDVLGRYGAEEQAAALAAARAQMDDLRRSRRNELHDRRKVCLGVFSAGGILLAVLFL